MLAACLSWYDEPAANLVACISSLAGVVDRLIAVDGAHDHYPAQTRASPPAQLSVIQAAAEEARLPCFTYLEDTWVGDEVGKRAFMMGRGVELAAGGWLLVIDGDETVDEWEPDLLESLAETTEDVVEIEFRTLTDGHESRHPARRLFRALPELTVAGRHSRYVAGDKVLWDGAGREMEEPAADLSGLLALRHHRQSRSDERQAARSAYYLARDTLGLES